MSSPRTVRIVDDDAAARIGRDARTLQPEIVGVASQPIKNFVAVEHICGLVRFLCSSDADSITGAVLPIEGG